MQVHGRDPGTECYRVTHEVDGQQVAALVPERLVGAAEPGRTYPSHGVAYTWMAEHKTKIETAIARLARGQGAARAPYDQITLIEER